MEGRGSLRRTQSLHIVSTKHTGPWAEAGLRDKRRSESLAEAGLRDKRKSVAQLVAQYQQGAQRQSRGTAPAAPQVTRLLSLAPADKARQDPRMRGGERGVSSDPLTPPLRRSKSIELLPQAPPKGTRAPPKGTRALRALFEYMAPPVQHDNCKGRGSREASHMARPDEDDGELKNGEEMKSKQDLSRQVVDMAPTQTAERRDGAERHRTVTRVFLGKMSRDDQRRRSVADFRESTVFSGRERPALSVSAMSALYLSKTAAANWAESQPKPTPLTPLQTGEGEEPVKIRFQVQPRKRN